MDGTLEKLWRSPRGGYIDNATLVIGSCPIVRLQYDSTLSDVMEYNVDNEAGSGI